MAMLLSHFTHVLMNNFLVFPLLLGPSPPRTYPSPLTMVRD